MNAGDVEINLARLLMSFPRGIITAWPESRSWIMLFLSRSAVKARLRLREKRKGLEKATNLLHSHSSPVWKRFEFCWSSDTRFCICRSFWIVKEVLTSLMALQEQTGNISISYFEELKDCFFSAHAWVWTWTEWFRNGQCIFWKNLKVTQMTQQNWALAKTFTKYTLFFNSCTNTTEFALSNGEMQECNQNWSSNWTRDRRKTAWSEQMVKPSVPHKPSKVKPKRLDRPPVAGPGIAHNPRLPMLFNATRDQLNN